MHGAGRVNKVAGLKDSNRLQHMCFPVDIAKVLRTIILKNICEQLLLPILCELLTN